MFVRITYANGSTRTFDVSDVTHGVPEVEVRGPVLRATPVRDEDDYEDVGGPTSRLSRSITRGH